MSQVTSQEGKRSDPMVDVVLLASASLSLVTLVAVLIYSRKLREAGERYVSAKKVLRDIILSFRHDLRQQEHRVQLISHQIEDLPLRHQELERVEQLRSEVARINGDLEDASNSLENLSAQVERLSKGLDDLFVRHEEGLKRIVELEEKRGEEPFATGRIEAAIPIKRDMALVRLTGTELRVLEILFSEGEKTAPQIRARIQLTREHIARLMKSLYARGYIERATERLPYVYRLKGEMFSVLERQTQA